MSGKITFVGAGPGAPDLITIRGAEALKQAGLVVYAGSLVNEKLLELAGHAELVNSAKLALEEVLELLVSGFRAGKKVVRLHTGDPAMYGAVSEQYRELDRLGIPYDVVPGVSSAFAAAAALKTEYTMPGLSMSVIMTRDAGRTPVPEKEELSSLAAHDCTMCIFLSVGEMHKLVVKLLAAGRVPATPAAVVYRASWENEKIVRGTLADIAEKVEAAGIKRQAMIVVGDVLNKEQGGLSRLYDRNFTHGCRASAGSAVFQGKCAVFGMTSAAVAKAVEIAAGLENADVFVSEKYADMVPEKRRVVYPAGRSAKALADAWGKYRGFVMVMAAGIVVRHIAPLCRSKTCDPAVVVCDERGDYAVSLLSGHLGGANRLASEVARITGGRAVVTTASDVRGSMAFDELASRLHYRVVNPGAILKVSSHILENNPVEVKMPRALFDQYYADDSRFIFAGESADISVAVPGTDTVLRMVPFRFSLGIGCRKGTSCGEIGKAVNVVLERYGISMDAVAVVASADVKAQEKGLFDFVEKYRKELRFFTAEQLNAVPVPNPSKHAMEHLGIHSVSEASALLGAGEGGTLFAEKTVFDAVTVALAKLRE